MTRSHRVKNDNAKEYIMKEQRRTQICNFLRPIMSIRELFGRPYAVSVHVKMRRSHSSTDLTPPPLTKQEESEGFIRLTENDPDARKTLIVHNLRLVVYIAKKFESPYRHRGSCIYRHYRSDKSSQHVLSHKEHKAGNLCVPVH